MTFGKRLRNLRLEKDLTQAELARLMGLGESTVSFYEADKRKPDFDTLIKLAEHFNVSTDYILGIKSLLNKSIPTVQLPILGSIRAGIPLLVEENYGGYIDVPEDIRADFVLEVVGNSMIGAGILEGDYVVCRAAEEPQTGQIVVALRNEGSISEATIKFYFNGNGSPCLRAANPDYSDIDYKDGYSCAGHMVALMRKDAPGYQVYKEYLAVKDSEEWTEVIELATSNGLTHEQIKSIIEGQVEIAKRLKGK